MVSGNVGPLVSALESNPDVVGSRPTVGPAFRLRVLPKNAKYGRSNVARDTGQGGVPQKNLQHSRDYKQMIEDFYKKTSRQNFRRDDYKDSDGNMTEE